MRGAGLIACVLFGVAACVSASAPSSEIANTSHTKADGTRAIRLSVWLGAPPAEVYRAIATVEALRKLFAD